MFISIFAFQAEATDDINSLKQKFKRLDNKYKKEYKTNLDNLNKYYELELNKLASKYTLENNQAGLKKIRQELELFKNKKSNPSDNPLKSSSKNNRKNRNKNNNSNNNNYNNNPYGNTTNNTYSDNPYTNNNPYNNQNTYNSDDNVYHIPQNSVLNLPKGSALLFKGTQYRGRYQMVTAPARFNVSALTIGDDSLSSLRLTSDNTMVILYKDSGFSNHVATIYEDTPSLENFDNQVSSIEIYRYAEIFVNSHFRGSSQKLRVPGNFRDDDIIIGNDELSSLRVPAGVRVILYEHNDFQGRSVTYSQGDHDFVNDFNDMTSSIQVVNE